MGDEETRSKRGQQRRRNFHAKVMNELHKAKVYDPRKQEYKRVKLKTREINESDNDDETTTRKDS